MTACPKRLQRLMRLMRLREHRGVTLIELAITLAVLAVLGALALPNMGARLAHQRVFATAQALASDLSDARFEAAQRGLPLHVQSSSGNGKGGTDWCWAVTTAPGCGCGAIAGPKQVCQLRNVTAGEHPGVRLSDAHDARLEPTGAATAQPVATLESARGEKLRVEISALGRARVCVVAGHWPQLPGC